MSLLTERTLSSELGYKHAAPPEQRQATLGQSQHKLFSDVSCGFVDRSSFYRQHTVNSSEGRLLVLTKATAR